jgi:hypothetical protein
MMSASKGNKMAPMQIDAALSVLDNQFAHFGNGKSLEPLVNFINNQEKFGYNNLNADAVLALQALLQKKVSEAQQKGIMMEKQQSIDIEQAIKALNLRKLQFQANDEGW